MKKQTYCRACQSYYFRLYRAQPCPCKVIDPNRPVVTVSKPKKVNRLNHVMKLHKISLTVRRFLKEN